MIGVRSALPMPRALGALTYLELHLIINRIRAILKDPKRWVLWLAFLAWLVLLLPFRLRPVPAFRPGTRFAPTAPGAFPPGLPFDSWGHGAALVWPGLFLFLLAVFVRYAAQRAPGLFSAPADARFLTGSAVPRRIVIAWLQLRMLRMLLLRFPLYVALWLFILPGRIGVSLGQMLAVFLTLSLIGVFMFSLHLPVFMLARRYPRVHVGGVALVLGAIGLIACLVAADRLDGMPFTLPAALTGLPHALPPGSWMVGGLQGEPLALVGLSLLAALMVTASVLVAGDCYPELWEASRRAFVVRRLMKQRGALLSPTETRKALRAAGVAGTRKRPRSVAISASGRHVVGGAWTLVWKEWLATRRLPGGLRIPILLTLLAIIVGYAIGRLTTQGPRGIGAALLVPLAELVLVVNLMSAFRLGQDLGNPLWWLSDSSLSARLAVLTGARAVRQFVPLAAGLVSAALTSGSALFITLGLPISLAGLLAVRAMGLATYAVIPSPVDMRGPGAILRLLAFIVLLIPVVVVFVVAAVVSHHLGVATWAAAGACLVEGWMLIVFAANQLNGNGLAYVRAERR
jgi:hypothetical protein